MKILNPIQVDNLLHKLDKKPGQNIVHFSQGSHLLTKKLQQFCQKIDSDYYLYATKDVFYDKSKTKYANTPHVHIVKFDLSRSSYSLQEKKYDCIISTLNLSKESQNAFLEKCYPILFEGGSMMIIMSHSSDVSNTWLSSLKASQYLVVEISDTLLDDHTIIMAKKMF